MSASLEIQNPTSPQLAALRWLKNRNGDGVFDKNNVFVAAGQRGPIMRATWNRLADLGLVEFYADNRRMRITDAGRALNLTRVRESEDDRGINHV